MARTEIITRTVPGRIQTIAAVTTAALMLVITAVTLPFADTQLPACLGFLPVFAGMTWIGDMMTAALLFGQARAVLDRSTAQLGTAFLFSGIAMIPHLLTIPGIFSAEPLIGAVGSAAWLWCFWHAGFSICLIRYALRRRSAGTGDLRLTRTVLTVVAVQIGLTLIGTAGLPFLPVVMQGNADGGLITSGVGPATLACSMAALVVVVVCLRGRATVDLWVAVAALTCTLDIALVLRGGSRFTLGWYVARVMALGTGMTVLIALLSEVADVFRRMSTMNRHLRQLSATDGLTGIANRRAFDEALARAWAAARREQTPISLLMVDIDHFKAFNDTYGHPAGDDCIRRVADIIASHARRPGDVAARLGGEEFGLLMPGTEEAGVAMIAERIRAGVEALRMPNAGSRLGCVSISGGSATLRPFGPDQRVAILTEAADQALYESKTRGRNRVSAFRGAAETLDVAVLALPA
jgi:diguanylate cyclase (GGDEF)-like protein